jgi:hypothetical protein
MRRFLRPMTRPLHQARPMMRRRRLRMRRRRPHTLLRHLPRIRVLATRTGLRRDGSAPRASGQVYLPRMPGSMATSWP